MRSAFVPPLEPDGRPGSRAPARGDAAPILSRSAHGAAAVVLMSVFLFLQRAAPADGAAPAPEPATPAVLTPADYADDGALVRLVWQHEPSVLEARAAAERAASEVVRARTYPNPTLDFTWGTIPVGPTNPPDLADPITNVPNYTFGLSELVEIAKRGPREAATVAEFEQADSQARATLLAKTFDLLRAIGKIARSQVRLASMAELVSASNELLDLDRARAAHGDVAPVDVERAEVEAVRLLASRDREVADLNAARAECTAIVATGCPEFASPHDARRFLVRATDAAMPSGWSHDIEDRRPDARALAAGIRAAEQRELLGHRKVVPDVTVRVGYTYDTFVVSGNQRNSLALGVQVPLPVLDRGQADVMAAHSAASMLAEERRAVLASGKLALESAIRQRDVLRSRAKQLDVALAKARSVRQTIEETSRRGGVAMSDVLLARRSVQELILERDDIDAEAFEAALQMRQTAALLPGVAAPPEEPRP